MKENQHDSVSELIKKSLPHISVDCVILGYHNHEKSLKVLLLQMKNATDWLLPGGFVEKEEPLDNAAQRVLKFRTGLDEIYLKQFHTFGNLNRSSTFFKDKNTNLHQWFSQRFITVGYYALVDYKTVAPILDPISQHIEWVDVLDLPSLGLDHKQILDKGLKSLRESLNHIPVGYSLLPEEFTMPELQALYEIILGRELNRGNFYRKIMKYDLLIDTGSVRTTKGYRSPKLYTFNKEVYDSAVKNGLKSIW